MRIGFAALACVAAFAAAPSFAQTAPGWTYAYTAGVATATRVDDRNRVVASMTCRPPDGVMVLSDMTFGNDARNVRTAAVRIGQMTINVPATVQGRGRRAQLNINLPQRPPVLAAVQQQDELSVTVNNVTHGYGAGSGKQMEDVAYACWQGN